MWLMCANDSMMEEKDSGLEGMGLIYSFICLFAHLLIHSFHIYWEFYTLS